jgi:hypothetical protein
MEHRRWAEQRGEVVNSVCLSPRPAASQPDLAWKSALPPAARWAKEFPPVVTSAAIAPAFLTLRFVWSERGTHGTIAYCAPLVLHAYSTKMHALA